MMANVSSLIRRLRIDFTTIRTLPTVISSPTLGICSER